MRRTLRDRFFRGRAVPFCTEPGTDGAFARFWRRMLAVLIPVMAAMVASHGAQFKDPLEMPAAKVGNLAARPMIAVTRTGSRLVAVGSRGLVIFSDDEGQTWVQAEVPVQSDLVAVHFPSAKKGWAVGHDGVVLHTRDAGRSWEKQLDGRTAYKLFTDYFNDRQARGAQHQDELQSVESNFGRGPFLPYLDVWFQDELSGYAVGSFGLLIATRDGGKTWEPWFDRIDNGELLNLNGVRGIGGKLYITGEQGIVFRFDVDSGRFVKSETGYSGSLFGIVGSAQALVTYGLRGAIYVSRDAGVSWQAASTPSSVTINAGMFDASAGAFLLVNASGEVIIGDAAARSFSSHQAWPGGRLSGIAPISGRQYVLSSPLGVRVHDGR